MLEINKSNFEELVLKSEKVTFVDYWSDGCEACKELMPGVHELAERYGDKIQFASLNIKGARRLAIGQKVMGLPAMIIYKDGEILDRMSPEDVDEDIDNIEAFIQKACETL